MSPDGLGANIQEVWRAIMQAETARGAAADDAQAAYEEALRQLVEALKRLTQADAARGSASAGGHAAYEEALKRFRHKQLEAFTFLIGSIDLLREEVDGLKAELVALRKERAAGGP